MLEAAGECRLRGQEEAGGIARKGTAGAAAAEMLKQVDSCKSVTIRALRTLMRYADWRRRSPERRGGAGGREAEGSYTRAPPPPGLKLPPPPELQDPELCDSNLKCGCSVSLFCRRYKVYRGSVQNISDFGCFVQVKRFVASVSRRWRLRLRVCS